MGCSCLPRLWSSDQSSSELGNAFIPDPPFYPPLSLYRPAAATIPAAPSTVPTVDVVSPPSFSVSPHLLSHRISSMSIVSLSTENITNTGTMDMPDQRSADSQSTNIQNIIPDLDPDQTPMQTQDMQNKSEPQTELAIQHAVDSQSHHAGSRPPSNRSLWTINWDLFSDPNLPEQAQTTTRDTLDLQAELSSRRRSVDSQSRISSNRDSPTVIQHLILNPSLDKVWNNPGRQ